VQEKLDKVSLFLLVLAIGLCIIAIVIASGALETRHENAPTMSFSWAQSSITLKPTENQIVAFDNPDNVAIQLIVTNISAPDQLANYIIASPSSIPENTTENVMIQFLYVPASVKENIMPDTYSVRIGDLLVYLDMTTAPPENVENVENVWPVIDSLWYRIDNILARLGNLENLRSLDNANLKLLVDNLRAEIALAKAHQSDNYGNLENLITQADLDNLRAYYNTEMARQQFLFENKFMQTDNNIANARSDAHTMVLEYVFFAAVVSIAVTYGFLSGKIPYIGKHTKIIGGEEGSWGLCPNCGLKFTVTGSKCPNPDCQHEFKPIRYPPRGKSEAMKTEEQKELEKQKTKEKTTPEKSQK